MFAHKGYQRAIPAPDDILDRWAVQLRDAFLLLDIVEDNGSGGAENNAGCASIKDLVCLHGGLDALHYRVG